MSADCGGPECRWWWRQLSEWGALYGVDRIFGLWKKSRSILLVLAFGHRNSYPRRPRSPFDDEGRAIVGVKRRIREPPRRGTTQRDRRATGPRSTRPSRLQRRGGRGYTSADNAMILQLRGQGLSWSAIAEQFPGRSAGAIQVRYQTKLKPVKEWEVEEIYGRRTLDNGAVELLVKLEGGEET